MKLIVSIILTALLAFVFCLYLPWWTIALAAFIVAVLIRQTPFKSWLSGFTGLALAWGIIAWMQDSGNHSILSRKIAEMFFLGGSSFLLILVTALVGALVGGFAALSASFLKSPQK